MIIILLLNRRHLSFRSFVVARDRCTSPSCIEYTVKRHACTSSDRIQKKAAYTTFPTILSCKTTSIVHHQSYLEHIALLIADDMLVVRMQRCLELDAWSHGTFAWLLVER